MLELELLLFYSRRSSKGRIAAGRLSMSAAHKPHQLKKADSVTAFAEAYGADFVVQDSTPRGCLS